MPAFTFPVILCFSSTHLSPLLLAVCFYVTVAAVFVTRGTGYFELVDVVVVAVGVNAADSVVAIRVTIFTMFREHSLH